MVAPLPSLPDIRIRRLASRPCFCPGHAIVQAVLQLVLFRFVFANLLVMRQAPGQKWSGKGYDETDGEDAGNSHAHLLLVRHAHGAGV